jgi:methylenetetrahydrofolate--tRNA-(uracil-5-)-methyltransferase
VEGYVESAAIGLLAGRFAAAERMDVECGTPPATTALGALIGHITGGHLLASDSSRSFQPMNINNGLLPPVEVPEHDEDGRRLKGKEKGRARKRSVAMRALADIDTWLTARSTSAAAE